MCGRLGCIFSRISPYRRLLGEDGYTKLLVIGASGMTGGAVMDAAVACVWFKVAALTRNEANLKDNIHVLNGDVTMKIGDMLEPATLKKAMEDIDVVFFSTAYWDTRDMECEYNQGVNVVKAAHTSRIKHLLYVGTPYCDEEAEVQCKCLAAKERVQQLVLKSGVPCTVIHMGFYYENFVSIFKPHIVEHQNFALALPMGNVPLNCGSILDFARCIAQIILKPTDHLGRVVKLVTGHHTLTQLVAWMDRKFPDVTIFDPKISIEEYKEIEYDGSEEIYAMFKFLLSPASSAKVDQKLAFHLCPTARSFTSWLDETEKTVVMCLVEAEQESGFDEQSDLQVADSLMLSLGDGQEFSFSQDAAETGNGRKKKMKTATCLRTIEEGKNFARRAALCDNLLILSDFMEVWRELLDSDG